MKLLRTREVPAENYTNAFVGYGSERDKFALELTYNWGVESVSLRPCIDVLVLCCTSLQVC